MNGSLLEQVTTLTDASFVSNTTSSDGGVLSDNNAVNDVEKAFAPLFVPCHNPRNLISPHVAETVDLVVCAGIFPVLVTFGVISNVINMAVFVRQGLSDRINLCLFR